MGEPLLILVATGVVVIVGVFGWLDAPRAAGKRLGKLVESTGLAIDGPVGDLVERRLRRRQRAMMLGMAAGALVGTGIVIAAGTFTSAIAWWIAAELGGTGAGALVVHVIDSGRAAAEPGPRAAVLRPRRMHDFLYPAETMAPLVALVLPVLTILLAVSSARGDT